MKRVAWCLPLFLAACSPKNPDLTLAISGVGMADLETIRNDLSRLKGVSEVRPGQLKDGKALVAVRYAGNGASLAADLSRLGSGLKNVTGFDDTSVQVSWNGAPPAAIATNTTTATAAAPAAVRIDRPPDGAPADAAPPAAPAPEAKPDPSRVEKDPLAYKVHQLAGGTVATFDGWRTNPLPLGENWVGMETHPEGKENDFQLIVSAGLPDAQI